MSAIALQGVSKIHPRRGGPPVKALKDCSLEIGEREFFVISGASGAGKTTLLRLIAGLEAPSAGEVLLFGKPAGPLPPHARGVAMVFQDQPLYPHLAARENIALALRLQRLPSEVIRTRIAQTARLLQLGPFLDRKPAELSGGERQRVALAMAVAREPRILLLDEPLAHLDPRLRFDLRGALRRLHRNLGITTVLVTHDPEEALSLADRIAVLDRGECHDAGPPSRLYREPATLSVALALGSPPINLLQGRFHAGKGAFVLDGDPAAEFAFHTREMPRLSSRPQEASLLLGLRAEDVRVQAGGEQPLRPPRGVACVEDVEALGPDLLLRLRAGAQALTARVPASVAAPKSGAVSLEFDASAAHWFDPGSGSRLGATATLPGESAAPTPG